MKIYIVYHYLFDEREIHSLHKSIENAEALVAGEKAKRLGHYKTYEIEEHDVV